jgi:hypothetical protein
MDGLSGKQEVYKKLQRIYWIQMGKPEGPEGD